MAPRFLIDENLSPRLAQHLRLVHGYDAVHVRDVGLLGATDEKVLSWAIEADRIVVTANSADFRSLGAARPNHPGLAILRDAVGQARQLALGSLLANAIDAARSQRGRVFEIDGKGNFRDYGLP
jgi:predicted nuclease of predicted toxin-antitoxin system